MGEEKNTIYEIQDTNNKLFQTTSNIQSRFKGGLPFEDLLRIGVCTLFLICIL